MNKKATNLNSRLTKKRFQRTVPTSKGLFKLQRFNEKENTKKKKQLEQQKAKYPRGKISLNNKKITKQL